MKNYNFEPVSKELQTECIERMILARTSLMLSKPFFGVLASRLLPVPNNTWCRTMAVDGKHLYYNVEFVMGIQDQSKRDEYAQALREKIPDITDEQVEASLNGLTDQNLVAVICHEILHCAYDHFLRRGMRDPKLFNIAADYAINQILVRENIGKIQDTWLYDKKYDGMTAEEIYTSIWDEIKDKQPEEGDGTPQDSSGGNEGKGEFRGTFGGTVDQHDIPQQEGESDETTAEQRKQYMEEFKSAMMNAARADGAPAEIRGMIQDFKEPKIDWRSKLHRCLRSWLKSDTTFSNPRRSSWSYGFGSSGSFYGCPIFPGMKPDEDIGCFRKYQY